jgi:hypothetical protein
MSNHFPVYKLIDKIKDLFECVVSEQCYTDSINNGLSVNIVYDETDYSVGQSSDIGENSGVHTITIHDNYLQFLWMLCYSTLASYDAIQMLLYDTVFKGIANNKTMQMYHTAQETYSEALKMLHNKGSKDRFMYASRSKICDLQRRYDPMYKDKADAILIVAGAYMLQHEYGHFINDHYEDTPHNEEIADGVAIDNIMAWCKSHYPKSIETTAVIGIIMSLVAAAYVNPTLTSPIYPDIDTRICNIIDSCASKLGHNLNNTVYKYLYHAVTNWIAECNIQICTSDLQYSAQQSLCLLKSRLTQHKQASKII